MALPPSLLRMAPQGSSGPASPPTGNPGEMADVMSAVGEVIRILEMKLPRAPIGTDLHDAMLKAITSLSKAAPPAQQPPGLQMTQLRALAQEAQKSAPMQALMSSMGSGAPGGAPGGAPPAAAPPQAA